jgi:hypothetical protein
MIHIIILNDLSTILGEQNGGINLPVTGNDLIMPSCGLDEEQATPFSFQAIQQQNLHFNKEEALICFKA